MKDFEAALEAISDRFSIPVEELVKGRRRFRRINEIRYCIYYILCNEYNIFKVNVGKTFGKDHTTIINGIRYIENYRDNDAELRKKFDIINDLFNRY